MIICEKCEIYHMHPLLKVKEKEFFTKECVFNFMITKQEKNNTNIEKSFFKKIKKFSHNLFEKNCIFKMFIFSNHFTVRPLKKFKITIIIYTNNKNKLTHYCQILILVINNKNL